MFTAAVVAVWAYHLPARHQNLAVVEPGSEEPSGLSGIIDVVKDEFTDMQALVGEAEQSSTSVRAEQSLQRAVDQARSESAQNPIEATVSQLGAPSSATATAQTSASSSSSTAQTAENSTQTEPRAVRIVTTNPSSTATSTE